jgi:hypothetical protein
MTYFLIILCSFIFIFNVYLLNLCLLKYKKNDYWKTVNHLLTDFDYFQFIGGPCDGEFRFLPKEKTYFIYKKIHHYQKNEKKYVYIK